ncbi:fumarylacetoacetate hydrolase family protein [Paraburkholderia pallida]|uniref:Fumarylacetoacetate hydrolase family protein n=1 Tax=Paraburkholderia pallida TaxID=2547399 RepID=A0A4P7CZ20_9BURK|nr:fumarylacetoacetate hydrolase family protein [Paraburkholderia pallida]QBR01581.1 fumarylacetoacetate hydrolase family protein [Paraburkholderia pallida]
MAVLILRYRDDNGASRWAKLLSAPPTTPDDVIDIIDIPITPNSTTEAVIAVYGRNPELFDDGDAVKIKAAQLQSPVTSDATLLCQGLNYASHAAEAGHHVRKQNLLFAKSSSSLCGPYDDIVRPAGVELLDYELEIGIVLRSKVTAGTVVDNTNVGDYVAGVVLCNDVSARDVMFGASFLQWYQGKSYRTFCPAGPLLYLLAPDEVATALMNLEISLTYQDVERQRAVSSDLIYKPAETLTQIAAIMDLKAGDLILTGTPGGVLVQGTPKFVDTVKTQLFDDARRREEMVVEMKTLADFLQPGETLALTMRDLHSGLSLGGQLSTIAEGASGGAPAA